MFNPLVDSFDQLSDSEVEDATRSLSRKYFQTRNPQVQAQISVMLEMYKDELRARMSKKTFDATDGESDLDNLINIS